VTPEESRPWKIEPLSASHVVSDFACGKEPLDTWLKKHALFNQFEGISRVFVAVIPGSPVVGGYYALSSTSIAFANSPPDLVRGFPKYPLPVAHIGRLAVTAPAQRQGLGEMLLFDAFEQVIKAADLIGIVATDVLAKDEEAKAFYFKYGFRALLDNPLHLCLFLKALEKLAFNR